MYEAVCLIPPCVECPGSLGVDIAPPIHHLHLVEMLQLFHQTRLQLGDDVMNLAAVHTLLYMYIMYCSLLCKNIRIGISFLN